MNWENKYLIKYNIPTLKYSPKYVSVWRNIIRNEITITNIKQKISESNDEIKSWSCSLDRVMEYIKTNRRRYEKVRIILFIWSWRRWWSIYNTYKIRKAVLNYYRQKFNDEKEVE